MPFSWWVGWPIIISLKYWKLHFHAPVGAHVKICFSLPQDEPRQSGGETQEEEPLRKDEKGRGGQDEGRGLYFFSFLLRDHFDKFTNYQP